jgi:hypothetical protein
VGVPVIGGLLFAGLTVAGGIGYSVFEDILKARLRTRELKLQEKRIQMEQQLRTDDLNAKILRMDDLGISPNDLTSLAEEVRQLREEVSRLKQDLNSRTIS